ncbi:hypothetical protein FXO37_31869 [Capsicum annuum]|nr:hypothetical protein FXO37_31869 [Capsicum annuum]
MARLQVDSEKLPKQSQSGQNEAEESDNSFSPIGHEIISKSKHDSIKTISINRFRVAMLMDGPNKVTSDLVLKCQLGKRFDELRKIMKNENINELLNKSCFAYFLGLPEDYTLYFPMSMVYSLLKHRIKYAGDDKDSKEDEKNG